ncbi:MAG TPA: hypothetical protein VFA85_13935 [Terriglobales bacterium]|nr:hypothetical protein [Terriglobales bacterium]
MYWLGGTWGIYLFLGLFLCPADHEGILRRLDAFFGQFPHPDISVLCKNPKSARNATSQPAPGSAPCHTGELHLRVDGGEKPGHFGGVEIGHGVGYASD